MTREPPTTATGGWAVTGLACRYPGVGSAAQLWRQLEAAGHAGAAWPRDEAARRLPAPASTYADFGIPPIYRRSINRVQLDVLELAREALAQAGMAEGEIDLERTDVIFCTAFGMNRCIENHARVLGAELASVYARGLAAPDQPRFLAAARQRLDQAFAATSHDKVGEMASSIASRIAACFKLRGRALALEAGDAGGAEALVAAIDALEQGRAQAVLIVGAQRIESELMQQLIARRVGEQAAATLCEGACALVLQGCGPASPRVLARIGAVQIVPVPSHRHWTDFLTQVRGPSGGLPCYWAVGGLLQSHELPASQGDGDAVRFAHAPCGYGYAMEGLTTLIHAVLARQHRPAGVAVRAVGKGLAGQAYGFALQVPGSARAATPVGAAPAVAVLAVGAQFGPAAGVQAYWDALCRGQPQFRPLDGRRFRPDIYRAASDTEALSYYIGAASFSDPRPLDPRNPMSAAPAFALAGAAAQEALAQLRAPSQWTDDSVLVVTASNLTLEAERRWAAQEQLPRIEQVLEALAREWQLPAAVSQQCLRALRDAAYLPAMDEAAGQGGLDEMAASGISRHIAACFGVTRARCIAVEAACAGSLAAIEIAINSLRSGRARVAIVAGVELPVNVHDLCLCSAQRMLAPEVIATFTAQATGFTPGDGAGVVVLALDEEARALGERSLARLLAVASCTESKSIIAPNPSGQIKSMRRAFEQVGFTATDVDFVETHGTGTLIGDEVEVESLASVYGATRSAPLRLGALKAQFGHCFAAAGMASVIKTVLALEHEQLPANHFAHPLKDDLRMGARGFDPLVRPLAWPRTDGPPRRAAVNAFGTGGVNVHLLLEEDIWR